jgi:hypothetical protein
MPRGKAVDAQNVERLLILLVLVVTVLALLNVPQWVINLTANIFVNLITGALISLVLGTLIEAVTGDLLKGILITLDFYGFKFSVSLFVIATIVLRVLIFR